MLFYSKYIYWNLGNEQNLKQQLYEQQKQKFSSLSVYEYKQPTVYETNQETPVR